jgi:hypothetical protein
MVIIIGGGGKQFFQTFERDFGSNTVSRRTFIVFLTITRRTHKFQTNTKASMRHIIRTVFSRGTWTSHSYILKVPKSLESTHLGFEFIISNRDFLSYSQPFYKPQAPLDSTRNALHKAPINRTKQEIQNFDIPATAVRRSRL